MKRKMPGSNDILPDINYQLRAIIEESPIATAIYFGKKITIQYANTMMLKCWDKDASVIGKTFRKARPELEDQHFADTLEKVYATGITYTGINEKMDLIINGKLRTCYFNIIFKPLFNENGVIYSIYHTAIDVTKEWVTNSKMIENENKLQNTILNAPFAMCIFRGYDYVIEIANKKMYEFWGRSAKEVLHKPLFEALPEAKGQGYELLLKSVLDTGKPFSAEELPVMLPRDGEIKKVFINFAYEPIRDADNTISGIFAVANDVTNLVMARQSIENVVIERTTELAEANLLLKQKNRELEQFAYIASHDLQEPVRKISTFVQMLKDKLGNVDEHSVNLVERIGLSSKRMLNLINDVLKFSRLSNEEETLSKVNLSEILKNVTTDFELLIEKKKAVINASSLPALTASAVQMNQLFTNLISNALKFSRRDEPPVINITAHILADAEKDKMPQFDPFKDYYDIEFSDNGIGFEQKYTEQIFEIFQRLHGKSEYEGTGIGLAICKKIIENHYGFITATSSLNNGAKFHIYLPIAG